jgi:FKBP-type peptidyl-prolyl cis-trans isomerase (trigger factor)
MKRLSGLKLLEEREGAGTPANKGDRVLFNMRLFLSKGDEVRLNETQATHLPKEMIRVADGVTLIDRTVVLGRREVMAGVEHALLGMKVGGYRKVRVSPHLAYREKGIPDLIPPDAVLIVDIWLREIIEHSWRRSGMFHTKEGFP